MEGSSSSSSNNSGDAVEPKSGCGCSSATVNNNNDTSSVATATTAKIAKMTDSNKKFIARAMTTEKIRHQENFRLKQEEQKNKLHQISTDEHHQMTNGSANTNGSSLVANVSVDETSEITITVSPTTGGQFDLSVLKTDSVESLKKVISKRLRVPKERICLLYRER